MPSKHVRVAIRTRPTADFAEDVIRIDPAQKSVSIHLPKSEDGGFINNQQDTWNFHFDTLLHNVSQEAVFEESAKPIVAGLLDGFNGTILAYGQTGAGKTFTMTGTTESYKHRGIMPRAISYIFRELYSKPQLAASVRISYLEIYNETLVDLLADSDSDQNLAIIDGENNSINVRGLGVHVANNEEEALNLLFLGETNRAISNHQLNRASSRSHCVLTVYLEMRSRVESSEKVISAKLNLVDLAGSERLSKTQSSGVTLKEAMYINKSLTFLEQVIIALSDKRRDHVPFRQSKLTSVLRDSLGGNCNTLMIGNIWGDVAHIEETISTLRFATRMMRVTNSPIINVAYDPVALVKKYEREIKELKQELAMHDTLVGRSGVAYEPLNDTARFELQKAVKSFLENEDNDIEIQSLRQVREVFHTFRVMYKNLESEAEERAKRMPEFRAQTSEQAGQPRAQTAGMDMEEDSTAVGDLESSGFGVGIAPGGARPIGTTVVASKKGDKGAKGKNAKAVTKTANAPLSTGEPPAREQAQDAAKEATGATLEPTHTQGSLVSLNSNNANTSSPGTGINAAVLQTANNLTAALTAAGSTILGTSPLPNTLARPTSGGVQPLGAVNLGAQRPSTYTGLTRAELFEEFKRDHGKELAKNLSDAKANLREKRKQVRELAEQVNDHKRVIDGIISSLHSKRDEQKKDDLSASDGGEIIDTEEFNLRRRLNAEKASYRARYDALQAVRTESEYVSRVADQCRLRLLTEFEKWHEDNASSPQLKGNAVDYSVGDEDVLDIGEKFERMHLERMSREDPESLAFYNARRSNLVKKGTLHPSKAANGGIVNGRSAIGQTSSTTLKELGSPTTHASPMHGRLGQRALAAGMGAGAAATALHPMNNTTSFVNPFSPNRTSTTRASIWRGD